MRSSFIRLSAVWLVAMLANAETAIIRSGNGNVGGRDASVSVLIGPATGGFGHLFTSADFTNAQVGPAAFIVQPSAVWLAGLGTDSAAKWIGTNANASCCQGNTALYALSFPITKAFVSANLTLQYAVDDSIGEVGGLNSGLYLNGTPICGNSFVIGFSQEHYVSCDVSQALHVGTNWLYVEDGNAVGAAGLLFSATINTVSSGIVLAVPGTAMPWLYGAAVGGRNQGYQFGLNDGTAPVVVSSTNGFDFTAGHTLTATYLGGTVSVGPEIGIPYTDAGGLLNDTFTSTGTFAPGHYMSPVAFVGELVGTFTDSNGSIVGTPFAIGDGPATLTIPPGATQLQLGVDDDTYSTNIGAWSIQVTGTPNIVVPSISPGGIVNSASSAAGPVAPGSIALVYGSFPLTGSTQAPGTPWPNALAGLSMQFGTVPAPIYYASGSVAVIQIPWELQGTTQASLTATINGQTSAPQVVTIASVAPGIFALNEQGSGQGAITDISGRLVDSTNPTQPGNVIVIYCTGLGAVATQPATGAPDMVLAQTMATPTVTVGGIPASVQFAGLAPTSVGEYQLNVQIPPGVPSGNAVPVVLSIAGASANTVTIAVQTPSSQNPSPVITSLTPNSAQAGSGPLTLAINGNGFTSSSTVVFNSSPHPVSYISGTQIAIALSATDLAAAGTFAVVVSNPPPGGGTSTPIDFIVSPATVTIPPTPTGLSPGSATSPGVTVSTLTPTLSWNASPGATGYVVAMVNYATGATIIDRTASTTSIVSPVLVNGATYEWGVSAYNAAGLDVPATSSFLYFKVSAAQTSLPGTWSGNWISSEYVGAFGALAANLTQSGTALTGTVSFTGSSCLTGGPVSGTVIGGVLSAGVSVGGGQTLSLSGTINAADAIISGTYALRGGTCIPNGDAGTFSLVAQ